METEKKMRKIIYSISIVIVLVFIKRLMPAVLRLREGEREKWKRNEFENVTKDEPKNQMKK